MFQREKTMRMINQIYGNTFGIAYYWNGTNELQQEKIQLVFKETGFNLTFAELEYFSKLILESEARTQCCSDCKLKENCNRFLLQTPASQIDLAVSIAELHGIQDLVAGTIFKINMQNYLTGVGKN